MLIPWTTKFGEYYKRGFINVKSVMSKIFSDIKDLKKRLIEEWSKIQESVIDATVDQWRRRLHAWVRANGGHFEHKL